MEGKQLNVVTDLAIIESFMLSRIIPSVDDELIVEVLD